MTAVAAVLLYSFSSKKKITFWNHKHRSNTTSTEKKRKKKQKRGEKKRGKNKKGKCFFLEEKGLLFFLSTFL